MRRTGVLFNGLVYGGSGYADENLHVVLGLAGHGIPVQLEPRGARSDTGKLLSPDVRAQLDALAKVRVDPQQSMFFVSAPAHEFQPQMYYARHTVGRTTFETDRIPDGWRERCNALDEIWVPSYFNLETFARAGVAEHKLHVLQEGVDTEHFRPGTQPLKIPGTRGFNFLSVFDWQMRKGYDILLRAYCEEFRPDEDVALILKVSTMNQPHAQLVDLVSYFIDGTLHMKLEQSPNIVLLTGMLPHARFPRLYASADAFVLPTRGEGWGPPEARGFTFLFVGGAIERKGVHVLVKAYQQAFTAQDDVTLIIKDIGSKTFYRRMTLVPWLRKEAEKPQSPRLLVLIDEFDETKLAELYRGCDAFVLPYRGEGFGMPLVEAMACGKPVITTAEGPAPEFCPADCSYLIPAKTVPIPTGLEGFGELAAEITWFEPDADELARLMREVFENRTEAAVRGARAGERICPAYDWRRATEMYLDRIAALTDRELSMAAPALHSSD